MWGPPPANRQSTFHGFIICVSLFFGLYLELCGRVVHLSSNLSGNIHYGYFCILLLPKGAMAIKFLLLRPTHRLSTLQKMARLPIYLLLVPTAFKITLCLMTLNLKPYFFTGVFVATLSLNLLMCQFISQWQNYTRRRNCRFQPQKIAGCLLIVGGLLLSAGRQLQISWSVNQQFLMMVFVTVLLQGMLHLIKNLYTVYKPTVEEMIGKQLLVEALIAALLLVGMVALGCFWEVTTVDELAHTFWQEIRMTNLTAELLIYSVILCIMYPGIELTLNGCWRELTLGQCLALGSTSCSWLAIIQLAKQGYNGRLWLGLPFLFFGMIVYFRMVRMRQLIGLTNWLFTRRDGGHSAPIPLN